MGAASVRLREVRAFLVLAEELHFGRTAERLHLTAARVSQAIATLERRVGGQLFDRTSRRVTATARGHLLRRCVEAPYAAMAAAVEAAAAADVDVSGERRLGRCGPSSTEDSCPGRPADVVELHDLQVFLVLAAELHFARTAQRLLLTRSRVSQIVATLERLLGGRLFERTSRQVTLTERGQRLREDLSVPYAEVLTAVHRARAMDAELHGELRIGLLGPSSGGPELLEVSTDFERRHPSCSARFVEIPIGDGVEPLRCGHVDLMTSVLAGVPPDLTSGPRLRVDARVLVVAANHPLAGESEVSIEVLGDYPVARPQGWTSEMEELFIPRHTPSGRPVVRAFQVASMAALWPAVARGEVVHLSTTAIRHYSTHPGLVYVPVPDAAPATYGLTWRTDNEDPRIPAFVAIAEERDVENLGP